MARQSVEERGSCLIDGRTQAQFNDVMVAYANGDLCESSAMELTGLCRVDLRQALQDASKRATALWHTSRRVGYGLREDNSLKAVSDGDL